FGRGTLDIVDEIEPGDNQVTVRIDGSEHREPVEESVEVRWSESLEVDASFEQVVDRLQRGLAVEGVARDALGPVGDLRVTVRLRREGQEAATADDEGDNSEESHHDQTGQTSRRRDEAAAFERHVTTDPQGRFRAFFSGESLEDGVWHAETVIVPESGSEMSVSTEPVDLNRRTSRWILNALGLLGLLGAVALVLQRLWTVIAAQIERRRRKRQSRSRSEDAFAEAERLVPKQLDEAQAVDDKPDKHRVSGLVWDVWKTQPLGGAELVLSSTAGEPVRTQTSSAGGTRRRGGFVFDALEPGEYLLEIDAVGFMPGRLSLRIPHEGTLSNVRLDLVAVPLKIRRLYQSLVEMLEGEDLWGRLSPRQIEDTLVRSAEEAAPREDSIARREFVRGLRRRLEDAPDEITGEGLAAMMTDLVEETYFSGRVFDASIWHLSRDIAVRLRERFEEEDAS
ncbi:MAG: carboxypeptidase-like regulatory domain-containing protein, partial [Persicimonas sp.]